MSRRVAVIGAGSSGLVSIKCCLDEGLEPVCFESSNDIGGLWRFKVGRSYLLHTRSNLSTNYTQRLISVILSLLDGCQVQENPEADRASIYHSVIINTSKEMMCYSDFPIPAHYPNYMHNSLIMDYFRMYADNFQLTKHIRFNVGAVHWSENGSSSSFLLLSTDRFVPFLLSLCQTKVLQVKQRSDFSRSGQWDVETENKDGKREKHIFDAVLICIGHHCHPNLPLQDFPGATDKLWIHKVNLRAGLWLFTVLLRKAKKKTNKEKLNFFRG